MEIKELWMQNPGMCEKMLSEMTNADKAAALKEIASAKYEVIYYNPNGRREIGEGIIHNNMVEEMTISTIFGEYTGNGAELLETIKDLKDSAAFQWLKAIGADDSIIFSDAFFMQSKVGMLLDQALTMDQSIVRDIPTEVLPSVLVWLWGKVKDEGDMPPFIDEAHYNEKGHVIVSSKNAPRFIGKKGFIVNRIQKIIDKPIVVL